MEALRIEVCHVGGMFPSFIFAIYGKAPLNALADMEDELNNKENDTLSKGDGEYTLCPSWNDPQIDGHGRVEFSGYWSFAVVEFKPLQTEGIVNATPGNAVEGSREGD
jgi:hypothetical protein